MSDAFQFAVSHQFGLKFGGQSSSKLQKVFCLFVDPLNKSHKDSDVIDLSVPRHAQYLQKGSTLQFMASWADVMAMIHQHHPQLLTPSWEL